MHSHRSINNHAWTWKCCFRCLLGVAHGTLTTSQWEMKPSVDAECPLGTGMFAVSKGKCEWRSGGSPSSRKPTGEWGPQTPGDSGAAEAPSLLPLFPEASRLGCERVAGCSQRLLGQSPMVIAKALEERLDWEDERHRPPQPHPRPPSMTPPLPTLGNSCLSYTSGRLAPAGPFCEPVEQSP